MRPGLGQHTQLRQELKINPRLYQAMDLLYMPLLDLQQHLKQELLNNPFLDMVEPDEEDEEEGETSPGRGRPRRPKPRRRRSGEIDWEEILLDGFDAGGRREEHEEREYYEPVTVRSRDLSRPPARPGHAARPQRPRRCSSPRSSSATSTRTATWPAVSRRSSRAPTRKCARRRRRWSARSTDLPVYTTAEAEEMLGVIQSLDPPGVGARDLRECLMLQLREAGLEHSVPFRLVRDCFDELIAHRWSEISKRFGISPADVQKAADEIAKLDPKPGLVYSDASDNYIIPDLIVDKIDGKYHVFLNDANLPRLKLSKAYQEIARDKKKFDGENKEFISNKLNSANWMIQAIEQRRQTMLKVMNYIVDRQREFFEKGVQYLKPLTLREVAEVINMHESHRRAA